MSETTSPRTGLTRRSFLKTTGAVAGALAVSEVVGSRLDAFGQSVEGTASNEEVKYVACRGNCHGGCQFKCTVRNNKVVKNEMAPMPNEAYNRMCSKGLSMPQMTYSPDRIKYPMRRVAGTERGAGQWERISWEEAIGDITTKWKECIAEHGGLSIAQSGACSGTLCGGYVDLAKSLFGFSSIVHQADMASIQTAMDYVGVDGQFFGGTELADVVNAKNLFLFGINSAISVIHSSPFIYEMKKNGGKVVSIDPNCSPTVAKFADIHVALRTGTDGMLYMGILHVLLDEGLVDEGFLKSHSVAPFLVRKSDGLYLRQEDLGLIEVDRSTDTPKARDARILVLGTDGTLGVVDEVDDPVLTGVEEVEGVAVATVYDRIVERLSEYPLGTCSEVCGISEDVIRELAHLYADGPTATLDNYGADHYTNGHTGYEALYTVHAFTGNLLKRGAFKGGIGASADYAGVPAWLARLKETHPVTRFPQDRKMEELAAANDGKRPSLRMSFNQLGEALGKGSVNGQQFVKGYDGFALKSWWITGMNPLPSAVNRRELLDEFDKIDLIVVQDIMWTESAEYADIVLPVAFYTEATDLAAMTDGKTAPFLQASEKCVDPQFESKTDFEIVNLVLEGMGYGHLACSSSEEWLRFCIDNSKSMPKKGITLERIFEEKVVEYVERPETGPALRDGTTCYQLKFPTTTGRINIYTEEPRSSNPWPGVFDVDRERMLYWEPPLEAWPFSVGGYEPSEAAKKYPLSFHWKRSRFATHTKFSRGCHWLDEIEPEPYLRINTDDAIARGINTGDYVKVFNDRGWCVIKAHRDNGLQPGCIDSPQRWQGKDYREGNMVDLANTEMHPYMYNSNFNECQVEVEKYQEA
ncbi:molybdopterin-dependent oxidoreductase [Eggerthella guodeyinii]|uniref:Molybdopterin-dependent oxidoreductase n=1 Tax=Eggerthella guodeyinii TaxID=2690837 RepID=A0A6N7RQZ2_9ACTN|nr:molybdopterin-dependent oxidoreductase [Eggerthella guodeyinii]MRX83679.1 molybdopterin-dependent oxidoreductase [Eggerthella guodeyinii]